MSKKRDQQLKATQHDILSNSANENIVKQFEKLIDQVKFDMDNAPTRNDRIINSYRLKQIQAALNTIRLFPKPIKAGIDLKDIKGIGKGTMARIDEILKTGKLEEIKLEGNNEQYLKYIEDLEQVFGIGRRTAYVLITKYNIKSVQELKTAYNNGQIALNDQVLTGLKYYDLYKKSIPREEMDKIFIYLQNIAMELDPELFVIICGSYRRLRLTSNDIDVLITHPKIKTKLDLESSDNYLLKFIAKLKEKHFLIADLTDKNFESKYMGYSQFNEGKIKYPIRRIDIRYFPDDAYYAAILYFTGSGEYNRRMRELAKSLGFQLNEYGLYKIHGTKKIKIKVNSEKEIFDKLGMEYIPPEKRNVI